MPTVKEAREYLLGKPCVTSYGINNMTVVYAPLSLETRPEDLGHIESRLESGRRKKMLDRLSKHKIKPDLLEQLKQIFPEKREDEYLVYLNPIPRGLKTFDIDGTYLQSVTLILLKQGIHFAVNVFDTNGDLDLLDRAVINYRLRKKLAEDLVNEHGGNLQESCGIRVTKDVGKSDELNVLDRLLILGQRYHEEVHSENFRVRLENIVEKFQRSLESQEEDFD